jgi:hypothetical protein
MKKQWISIIEDSTKLDDADKTTDEVSLSIYGGESATAGDEKEEGSVVHKMRERKYRVGTQRL